MPEPPRIPPRPRPRAIISGVVAGVALCVAAFLVVAPRAPPPREVVAPMPPDAAVALPPAPAEAPPQAPAPPADAPASDIRSQAAPDETAAPLADTVTEVPEVAPPASPKETAPAPVAPPAAPPAEAATAPPAASEALPPAAAVAPTETAPAEIAAAPAVAPRARAPMPAWQRFAAPPPATAQPRIVVVVDGLGVDRALTAQAIALPPPLELSFVAYGEDVRVESAAARHAGHELLLHVPMATMSETADGAAPPAEVVRRLRWALDQFGGYVGVYDHMDEGFADPGDATATLIGEVKARGLMLLESRAAARALDAARARSDGVPFATRDLFLDTGAAPAIAAKLAAAEDIARRNGSVVAIAHAQQRTLAALAQWLPTLARKGLVLAPLSAVVAVPSE